MRFTPDSNGLHRVRTLTDGRVLTITAMTYGNYRLCLSQSYNTGVYDDGW